MLSLVTGATGFLGARLVRRLTERGAVRALVRPTSRTQHLAEAGAQIVVADLADGATLRQALDGVDAVYHLAGVTHGSRPSDFLPTNEGATERLCAAAAERDAPPVVVVVSSLAAAGPSPEGRPHTEASPPRPTSLYGRSKLLGERAARRHAAAAPISIVRPPVVFGPGDRDGLLLFRTIRLVGVHLVPQLRGLPLSLVYVDDLVEAFLAVAERGERLAAPAPGRDDDDPTGVYYAADPRPSSYAEMGRMAAAALGRRVWVVCRRKYPLVVPALVGDLVGRLRGRPSVLNSDKLREASASGWVCDPGKIVAGLDWRPSAPLDQRYRDTAHWYEEHGWL